ncbi:hypothetical protein F751_3886 [Auxenochlorella protothecoides]|uniref:Uncharacterized protein n=1 Tax=Auxenochlorella protothecoides TaxID=3075 RepID=A0A087SD66_AUXPR|nr:hypothetical protein F751_3886 [Auxenochlorella protothecoides]KFM23670.1 hypothetical protein F751_3886 [Auxenochlorella protothecoides]
MGIGHAGHSPSSPHVMSRSATAGQAPTADGPGAATSPSQTSSSTPYPLPPTPHPSKERLTMNLAFSASCCATCLASTAEVYSREKVRLVMLTSSSTMLK